MFVMERVVQEYEEASTVEVRQVCCGMSCIGIHASLAHGCAPAITFLQLIGGLEAHGTVSMLHQL